MEVEVKVLEVERDIIEKKLEQIGAVQISSNEVHTVYFSNGGDEIRVRETEGKVVICSKRVVDNSEAKVREETEMEAPSLENAQQLLMAMGFTPTDETSKYRIVYEKEGIKFMLDKYQKRYDYIPLLLEIEGDNVNSVYSALSELGYSKEDAKPWTREQLFTHYKR